MNKQQEAASADSLQALRDIDFIKQFIHRNKKKLDHSPPYLFIWGTYLIIGMVGMQFDNVAWPMWYFSIGTVIGGALSAIIGIRQGRASQMREKDASGWMFGLPFLAMVAAGWIMMATDIVRTEYLPLFWFMLVGILYVSMGAWLGKGPMLLGVWFILLAALTRLFFLDYQYLLLGLLGGGSVILTGLWLQLQRRRHE
ncbi:hypothetical protein [Paenibacillus paridis]|uniref:hypothetical protein n=1 Tax=Paenibacillus paridis TaxID=2583376 RepID=UPI0011204DD3|nr:hypothetical protein [Paenibacillus paridis]